MFIAQNGHPPLNPCCIYKPNWVTGVMDVEVEWDTPKNYQSQRQFYNLNVTIFNDMYEW